MIFKKNTSPHILTNSEQINADSLVSCSFFYTNIFLKLGIGMYMYLQNLFILPNAALSFGTEVPHLWSTANDVYASLI